MNKISFLALTCALASISSASVTLNLGALTNGTLPGSSYAAPYLTAKFEDSASLGGVLLTMTNTTSGSLGLFATSLVFNSEKAITGIVHQGGLTAGGASYGANAKTGANDIHAGKFDLEFSFPASGTHFGGGKDSVYLLKGTGLTETDFISKSVDELKPNNTVQFAGGYYGAAKIQGYGSSAGIGTKDYVQAVPEPTTMAALGFGALGLLKRRRKA